jgi:hypothetical protein
MLTSEITDEETIKEAQKGVFTGYSATTIPKEYADNASFKSQSQGLLLKDIPNPVVFAVSLVRKPCVKDARFCKLKHIQNEESDMNEEDKQFLQKLKETFSFKSEHESEAVSSDELKQELASFKSEFKSELIAGVTQGVAQAFKEALAQPKKKPKKEEGEEGEEEEDKTNSNNNGGDNNSTTEEENNAEPAEEGEEGDAEDKNKNKKKKPPASTKGAKLHDGPEPPASTKSASQTVYEIMGRDSRGQRIKQ